MGKGRLTIIGVEPAHEVELTLEMLAPMEATHRLLFVLASTDRATRVTWRMDGTNRFVGKAMPLVTDMDETVGGQFERGLASLKALAEAEAQQRQGGLEGHDAGG